MHTQARPPPARFDDEERRCLVIHRQSPAASLVGERHMAPIRDGHTGKARCLGMPAAITPLVVKDHPLREGGGRGTHSDGRCGNQADASDRKQGSQKTTAIQPVRRERARGDGAARRGREVRCRFHEWGDAMVEVLLPRRRWGASGYSATPPGRGGIVSSVEAGCPPRRSPVDRAPSPGGDLRTSPALPATPGTWRDTGQRREPTRGLV